MTYFAMVELIMILW